MKKRDSHTLDLTQQKLCLATDLRFWPIHQRGELVYRIEIPKLHRFFRIGYEEYVFISLLDGKTTIPQACGLAAAKLGSRAPTASDATTIAKWLLSNDLAYLSSESMPSRDINTTAHEPDSGFAWIKRFNPFWMKLPLPKIQPVVHAWSKALRPMFGITATTIGVCLIVVSIMVLVTHWTEFAASSSALFLPGNWFGVLVAWVLLKIVHELAHAVTCERMGCEVRETGIVFILFAPLAYVDVSSCWRLNSRWSRIAVSSAGMYVEMMIAAIAVLIWVSTDSISTKFMLYQVVVTAGLSTLLFNANVLMRFDGYFILADLVDIPNLNSESSRAVTSLVKRIVTGERSADRSLGSWRKHFVTIYGIAALLWRIVVCVSLFIAASTMFEGAGIAISLIGVIIWLAGPLRSLFKALNEQRQAGLTQALRPLMVSSCLVASLIWFVFLFPIPTSISLASVVQYRPETTVRSRADGFVTHLHVIDGADVVAGDRLLELENRELTHQLANLELTWKQNDVRFRKATEAHDAAEQEVVRKNQVELEKQIEPLRERVLSLTITAPRSGRVIARGLADRLGDYVAEGEPLMIVAGETDKQLVAVIGQDVIDDARECLGQDVVIRCEGFPQLRGRLERIEPRATDRLPSPALAVTEGGTLAVRPSADGSGEESLRLLEPVFRGRIDFPTDASNIVPAGARLWTDFGYRSESLAVRWSQSIRELWYTAKSSQ